ncbi:MULTISPECIES: lasso peptide biosynthesis B2 protein [Streptomyces]|uniref:lasso peptide biosynthesis B2 protein n=1 Tax=Streptomyces TaxID=1883 RepID=UPI000998B022|nr:MULTISPECIES: lasso peptide biosynthesis B2 protein [Streptomyces]
MTRPVPSRHTRTALTGRAGVVVNYLTGETIVLTGDALTRWLGALEHSSAPAPVIVRDSQVSWGTREAPARLQAVTPPPWAWRLTAAAILAMTLAVRTVGRPGTRFGRLRRIAEVGHHLPAPAASHARLVVRSVRWTARWFPARVACLEESTAASLLLALGGRGGAWRHGVATDPIRLHAWICDIHGLPVEEPEHTGDYTPINTPTDLERGSDVRPAHPAARQARQPGHDQS